MKSARIRLLCLLLLALPPALQAQRVSARLDLGRREPKPDFYEYSSIDNGLVTLGPASAASSRFVTLTKYDADFRREWKKQVMEQNGRKTVDFVSVIGTNILVFVTELFPKENVLKTYYYAYNLAGDVLAEEEVLSVYPNEKEQKVSLQYVYSPNKRKLLCFKNLQTRRESEQLLYYIFDDEGDVMQNGEIALKYPDNRFRIRNLRISNEGNVYLLGKFYKSSIVREAEDFQFLIYRYDIQTMQGTEIPVDLGGRFISDLAFRLDRNENLYIAGFYSNLGTDQIAGTMLQKISSSGELLLNTIAPFDPDFLRNYLTSGQIERGRELRNFYMDPVDGIILRSDGGVLLLAERFYITLQSTRDIYGYWVDREIFHYDDVILTSVSADGAIEWTSIVEKMQQSDVQTSLSYFNLSSAAGNYIFYEYKPRRNGINVYVQQVGIDGQVTARKPLLKDYKYGNEFYPRFCDQVNNEEAILVYTQNRGKLFSVIRVRVDE
jgi:hypothetical protein